MRAKEFILKYIFNKYSGEKVFDKNHMKNSGAVVSTDQIESRILTIRDKKVMLDSDLAKLYGVTTGHLKRAVRRNTDRFPDDFVFEITPEEYKSLRSQIGILKTGQHSKFLPFAFTEHGALQLASVLRSPQATGMSIFVVRAFVKMRDAIQANKPIYDMVQANKITLLQHSKELRVLTRAVDSLKSNSRPDNL